MAPFQGYFGVMPAYAGALGAKLVTFYPQNEGLPTHHAVILLFRPETGEPGVVELSAGFGGAEDGSGETSGAVRVIESKVPVAAGAHDQDGLTTIERLTTALGRQG